MKVSPRNEEKEGGARDAWPAFAVLGSSFEHTCNTAPNNSRPVQVVSVHPPPSRRAPCPGSDWLAPDYLESGWRGARLFGVSGGRPGHLVGGGGDHSKEQCVRFAPGPSPARKPPGILRRAGRRLGVDDALPRPLGQGSHPPGLCARPGARRGILSKRIRAMAKLIPSPASAAAGLPLYRASEGCTAQNAQGTPCPGLLDGPMCGGCPR